MLSKGIVKGSVQMVIGSVDFYDIPRMAVFYALLGIISADRNNTPDSQSVTQRLHCLSDPLTDAHALSQGAYDLMGIGFFSLS